MKKISWILFLSAVFVNLSFVGTDIVKKKANKSQSFIKYYMSHPAHDWEGISKKITCVTAIKKDRIVKIAVVSLVSSFDSENESRDSHMLEVAEALKYPEIKFVSSNVVYENDSVINIKGAVTFHGKAKEVSFLAKQTNLPTSKKKFKGSFLTKLTDYNITPPSMMLVSMQDEFKVEFEVVFD